MSVVIDRPRAVIEVDRWQLPRHVYVLSVVLALVAAVTAALTYFLPDVLLGPAVTNGNARGTALVMMSLAVPVLLLSVIFTSRGSWRAIYFWIGSVFYLLYNAFLFLFLTPFNRLFLLNVATESLALFTTISLLLAVDREWVVGRMRRLPYRALAIFIWVIVALNATAWMAELIPALFAADPLSWLEGTGATTNAIYVQDLVFWLPLMAIAAWGVWNHRTMGILLTGSWLLFGVIESIGIGVDQWFGHQADPTSPVASEAVIPLMAALAVVNLIGFYFYLRAARFPKVDS